MPVGADQGPHRPAGTRQAISHPVGSLRWKQKFRHEWLMHMMRNHSTGKYHLPPSAQLQFGNLRLLPAPCVKLLARPSTNAQTQSAAEAFPLDGYGRCVPGRYARVMMLQMQGVGAAPLLFRIMTHMNLYDLVWARRLVRSDRKRYWANTT
ncbi:hypothetical protein DENSPDRAFT_839038 [Dentipellis sp. KUC8613]|nr:hypothetical protein DENSPDRAFT_839038 [Dentipellis sp. KUC8613]